MTGPLPPATRLHTVDALRGFALLGILAVNVWAFADPMYGTGATSLFYASPLDHVLRVLTSTLVETKFYLLFSFLFGYSFTLQMASAERAGAAFVPRMLRRQLGLLVLGVLHGVLLFHGEILTIYAVLGLVLLAAHRVRPKTAVLIACTLLLTTGTLFVVAGALAISSGDPFDTVITASDPALTAYRNGPLATLAYHASRFVPTQVFLWIIQGPSALAMFLLGFAAGRQQLLSAPDPVQPYARRLLAIGLPIGLLGGLFYGLVETFIPGGGLELLAFGIGQLSAPLLTASYGLLMLRLFRGAGGEPLVRHLAPLGRMSLSNYVLQSVALGLLFSGYGGALIAEMPSPLLLVSVLVIFTVQLRLSTWWLARHPYGPLEWLLRAVTLRQVPAWRRA